MARATHTIEKRTLLRMEMPYAIARVDTESLTESLAGEPPSIVVASEGRGPIYRLTAPDWQPELLLSDPGGCLSVLPAPTRSRALFAILQCFPGYEFHEAGIFELAPAAGTGAWSSRLLAPLPFAHRLAQVRRGGADYLIAATLAERMDGPGDWSLPGTVYAYPLPDGRPNPATRRAILTGIHRNHGLLLTSFEGEEYLLVGGAEGLKASPLSQRADTWTWSAWLDREVSEVHLCDLDGDGTPELVTIEPFHGERLVVYSWSGERWIAIAEHALTFGHGLWCGAVCGTPAVIVSSRSGSGDLELLHLHRDPAPRLESRVIDHSVGAANVEVIDEGARTLVFATNQHSGEVALYTLQ